MAETNRAFGWDDEIENDGEFRFIPLNGDYKFTVTDFERSTFRGSAKIPQCNMAVVTLSVETPDGKTNVTENLILYSSMEWKLSAFFRAIGKKKAGEKLRPDWLHIVGCQGRAKFKTRTYTAQDGTQKEANSVDSYYDYDPSFFIGAAAEGAQLLDTTGDPLPFE